MSNCWGAWAARKRFDNWGYDEGSCTKKGDHVEERWPNERHIFAQVILVRGLRETDVGNAAQKLKNWEVLRSNGAEQRTNCKA